MGIATRRERGCGSRHCAVATRIAVRRAAVVPLAFGTGELVGGVGARCALHAATTATTAVAQMAVRAARRAEVATAADFTGEHYGCVDERNFRYCASRRPRLTDMAARRVTTVVAGIGLAVLSACSNGSAPSAKSPPTPSHIPASPSAATSGTPAAVADRSVTRRLLGLPPAPTGTPLHGYLLIADRNNNRLLVVSPDRRVVWRFPRPGELRAGQRFLGPDDAFLTPSGRQIITNEEFADTIAKVTLGAHPHVAWEYGHVNRPGSGHGYLAHPDDAYQRSSGLVSVADIENCRVVWIDHARRVVRSIGHAGNCRHDPPRSLSSPNGDTPIPGGGTLVTEIGGWVDRFDAHGHLLWSVRTPTTYPSDAQMLPNGSVLVAGFNVPGRVDVIRPTGRVVWSYHVASGPGELNRPSLAVALPGGVIAVTDDWNHRVVLIDRRTKHIVWQYGRDGSPGRGAGYLDKPDGLAFIS